MQHCVQATPPEHEPGSGAPLTRHSEGAGPVEAGPSSVSMETHVFEA
jgi:hypothetical protein